MCARDGAGLLGPLIDGRDGIRMRHAGVLTAEEQRPPRRVAAEERLHLQVERVHAGREEGAIDANVASCEMVNGASIVVALGAATAGTAAIVGNEGSPFRGALATAAPDSLAASKSTAAVAVAAAAAARAAAASAAAAIAVAAA
eukprot:CAMPEP_0181172312 /NCGR_PEP_ID=MMETSP1096-20121128/2382_1 /TAXON_ID=156174 ORGANISM="Chrysochromulina ericina, Strain CCMP281" /NCGR_SAMPLE_ID=MMETSP1096 /ASSEMBLY_ACC=CAM_ASM_000453 /LENGTH=143 /DNA_ID=CAMNT_0023260031 /DNA_START=338 /DNA_END=770 /DNA_ORIENTATION=+